MDDTKATPAKLNALLRAVEYQRNVALTNCAEAQASLEIAQGAIHEQDELIAKYLARIAELEAQLPAPQP